MSTRHPSSASRPTSPPRRRCRRRPTARRSASCRSSPTARTPTSSSGSTTPRRGRPTASTPLARERAESWLPRYGGFISSEWEFAKGLQLLEEDPEVYARTEHWIEAADWIIWQLCGRYLRNACTAGYKGIFQDGAYPSRDFLAALNPDFADFAETKVAHEIGRLGAAAGTLTAEAAAWTGLPEGIAVAVGNVDAHVTAPAAQAVEPGQMLAIMGTSTCHVMNGQHLAEVPGMCGVVDGGIVDGLWGYEAGQSGVGDIFAWYVKNQVPARYEQDAAAAGKSIHQHLTDLAFEAPVGAHGLIALDWVNGNRSVLVNTELSGAHPGPDPRHPCRGGVPRPARVDGVRHPDDRGDLRGQRRPRHRVRGRGRTAQERDAHAVLRRRAPDADLGHRERAGSGARLGDPRGGRRGRLPRRAHRGCGDGPRHAGRRTRPTPAPADAYDALYAEYRGLHDHFGRGGDDVMKRLKAIRRDVLDVEVAVDDHEGVLA